MTLLACQSEAAGDTMPRGGFWSTAAVSDQEKLAVLRKVRAIDVCAPLPRAALGGLGQVRAVDNVGPDQCRVNIAVDGHLTGIDATWSAGVMFSGEPTMDAPVIEQAMGDVRVLFDDEPAQSDDPQVRGSCQAWADTAGAQPSLASLSAVVGPPLAAGATDALLGPRVPTVSVTADSAVAEKIMRETLPLLN
ncbi:hypothetical protein ACFVAV_07500 [Nocardia sp. NPDC057663]|uniref:hypothetical protein n=1 Tax=Nocardia sp. NPDC057663 TaxID=3346201 RepID=UPI00366D4BA4